jgi:hypothetical protein
MIESTMIPHHPSMAMSSVVIVLLLLVVDVLAFAGDAHRFYLSGVAPTVS